MDKNALVKSGVWKSLPKNMEIIETGNDFLINR